MRGQPTRVRLWASVAGLSADQLVAWGVLYYAYSVLSLPIAEDLGVPSRLVAGAFSCTLLVSAVLARPAGRVLDRLDARPVMVVGAAVAVCALLALATVRGEIPLLLVFAALGMAQALSLYETAFRAVVDWFPVASERSRALLVITSVAGFASTVFLPLTAFLAARLGWRVAVLVLASLLAVVTIPVRLTLPARGRRAVEHNDSSRIATATTPVAASLLGAGFALQAFAATGAIVCLVWHLVQTGEPLSSAAMLAGLAGASQVPGRLLLSFVQRRVSTERRLVLLFGAEAAALAAIATMSGPALVVAILCFGAANGVVTLERAMVVVEWFGRDRYGAINGHIASIVLLARAGAPFAVEVLHAGPDYTGVFVILAIAAGVGGVVIAVASRLR